jgi:hypothetical protein
VLRRVLVAALRGAHGDVDGGEQQHARGDEQRGAGRVDERLLGLADTTIASASATTASTICRCRRERGAGCACIEASGRIQYMLNSIRVEFRLQVLARRAR